ncbi:gamma-mobile-trio integrase GmtZ [Roseateles sp.]|uniref:gamma-mobile-trio integrase GmtZ n=1 Tax=Roseateles sp. TaxID=1971397 RepID=UPI003BA52D99
MTNPVHPDATLDRLISNPILSEKRKLTLTSIHEFCRAQFDLGVRSFQPAEVGKGLATAGTMAPSSYMSSAFPDYQAVGQAWQEYSDAVDLALDPTAPPEHPDSVLRQLLQDPKRRGSGLSTLRTIYRLCRDRFNRGERNFSPAAVEKDSVESSTATTKQVLRKIAPNQRALLSAWQKLADAKASSETNDLAIGEDENFDAGHHVRAPRFRASGLARPEDDPAFVFDKLVKARNVKSSTVKLLTQMQEVCSNRFEAGEFDFGRSASARAFSQAKVFASDKSLTSRLAYTKRYADLIDAWQAKADSGWIDFSPELPPTNPHAVFRRLRGKTDRADMLESLLGVHRICYLEHRAGRLDFSVLTLGKLLADRGILAERSMYNSIYDDLRTLADAWHKHARPWIEVDGVSPPPVRLTPRKSHDADLEHVRQNYPQFAQWRELAVEWLQTVRGGMGPRLSAINAFIEIYLTQAGVPNTPAEFLRRGAVLPDFAVLGCGPGSMTGRTTRNNYLYEFFEWVLLRNCSEEADDGELIVSPAFRNPLSRAQKQSGSLRHSQSVRSALPYGYIHVLRRMLAQGPNFRDWTFAQGAQGAGEGEIGRPSPDWYEVDLALIDKDDPDCVWRKRQFFGGRVVYQMWSPVRWVALLMKMLLPLRTHQVRLLDSGESDTWKFDAGKWILNDHPLADRDERKPWQQGVLRLEPDPSNRNAPFTILYINTNKTADMDKEGPYKGYTMPWYAASDQLDNVYFWFEKLRNWQSKYNPIKRRTAWLELGGRHITAKTDAQYRSYSDACFLFRQPEEAVELRGLPVTDGILSNAWFNLLEALQDKLAEKKETHPDGQPIVFVGRDEKGRNSFNDFPLHSLRISLITALALDGKVPFPILQKLVGHTRLLMTLYYTKPGLARITETLTEAAAQLDANKEVSIHGFLRNTPHEKLIRDAICNSSGSLSATIPIHPGDRNPAGWMLMHHGLCLVGGNVSQVQDNATLGGCYNGGPFNGTQTRISHDPVPGGARNCVRCRWFVTEPHYLQALTAHFNNAAYHFDESRNRAVATERKWQELLRRKAEMEFADELFTEHLALDSAERLYETTVVEFSEQAETLVATWRLIERCIDVLNGGEADGTQLVIQGSSSEVKAVFEEIDSELLQLCGVCENIHLYPDLGADKAVLRRSQLLDSALYNEGLPPMFMKLSEEDQLSVGNAFMQRLSRLASPTNPFIGQREVIRVIDAGKKLGESLGIELSDAVNEIQLGKSLPYPTKSLKKIKS